VIKLHEGFVRPVDARVEKTQETEPVSYRLLLFIKFVAVAAYAGGVIASFVASAPKERSRAAHSIASPALLVVWITGYLLSLQHGVSLAELWTAGGLSLSFFSQFALVYAVGKKGSRSPTAFALVAIPFVLVLFLMVYKPTWQTLGL
jgi:hypothetical protein